MSIEVVLEGKLEEEKDFEGYIRLLKELCESWKLKIEEYEHFAVIDVCPEGYIEISYEDTFLSISAQTNVAGPGFHAYVCDFFQAVMEKSPITLTIQDPTQYFNHHNFEKLKHEVFERWLKDIASYIEDMKEEDTNLCISWPIDDYQPKQKEGSVVTPMGYITIHDFETQDAELLADRFFIWNHLGRDALYYRSSALNLLWKECYFQYSNMNEHTEKIANTIIDYLEIAHEKDPCLPLPMNEYEKLCSVIERTPTIKAAKRMISLQEIGYRKDLVEYHFGNWSIPADGCAEKSMDEANQTLYLMAPYRFAHEPWQWMYKVNVYSFKQDVQEFLLELLKYPNPIQFQSEHIQGILALEQGEAHTMLHAQLNSGKEMMLLQAVICQEEDIEQIKEQVMKIQCRKINDDSVKA